MHSMHHLKIKKAFSSVIGKEGVNAFLLTFYRVNWI